jgi:hypothetical protein
MAVDSAGNPHMLVPIGVTDSAYSIRYNKWHALFDVTKRNGAWTAMPIADLKSAPLTLTTSGVVHWSPHVSRTRAGSRIFFSWTETVGAAQGAQSNAPDFHARALDIRNLTCTQILNFSSCNPTAAGKIFHSHVAAEVLEPSTGNYKLAPVYAVFGAPGNENVPCSFNFLDGCAFSATQFTATPGMNPPFTSTAICAGQSVLLNPNGSMTSYTWSPGGNTGATLSVYADVGPTVYTVPGGPSCTVSLQFTVTGYICEGIRESASSDLLTAYPVPSNGAIHLSLAEKADVNIYNMDSRKIWSQQVSAGITIELEAIPAGVYIIEAVSSNSRAVRKIVVE